MDWTVLELFWGGLVRAMWCYWCVFCLFLLIALLFLVTDIPLFLADVLPYFFWINLAMCYLGAYCVLDDALFEVCFDL